ncbi:hypothetical protein LSAT2_000611 [Lamellibrachia satsuma]|nr:hypothetical protein LSAT2_000611 [Lamellibrachia satsuma]
MKSPAAQKRKQDIVTAKLKYAGIFTFVVGLLTFIVGVALLAVFSRSMTPKHQFGTGRAMVYAGLTAIVIGFMFIIVSVVVCVVSYLRTRRHNEDGDESRGIRVDNYAPGTETTFDQDDNDPIYKPGHGSAPLAMSTPMAMSPAPSVSIAPPPYDEEIQCHPVEFQRTVI